MWKKGILSEFTHWQTVFWVKSKKGEWNVEGVILNIQILYFDKNIRITNNASTINLPSFGLTDCYDVPHSRISFFIIKFTIF